MVILLRAIVWRAILVVHIDLNPSLREVAYSVLCCIFLYLFVCYSAPSCAGDQTCILWGSIAAAAVHTKPCSPGFEAEGRWNRMEKEEMPLQETGARNSAMRLCTFFVHRVCMYVQITTHTCQLNHARHGTNRCQFKLQRFWWIRTFLTNTTLAHRPKETDEQLEFQASPVGGEWQGTPNGG